MKHVSSFKQYLKEEQKEAYFTFGRLNPPTTGHGKLLGALAAKAGKGTYKVFLSQSQDAKKNPLSYEQKVKHVRKMFPKFGRNVILNRKIKTVFDIATLLYDQGNNRITMVVGSDRITEFKTLLDKYNGVKGKHGFYNFEKINVASAGDRDPDSNDVSGMSASKQRKNAANNDFTTFSQGLPSTLSAKDAKRLFNDIRVAMGLKETVEFKHHVELESVSDIREKYVSGELFNEDDRVMIKSSNKKGYVHRLGANYLIVALDEGRISRQWLDNVVAVDEKKTDEWYPDQPEWGTPESTAKAKKMTPMENTEIEKDYGKVFVDSAIQIKAQKKKVDELKAKLDAFGGKSSVGLTSNETRSNPKWKSIKSQLDAEFKKLQNMNSKMTKIYGKQMKDLRNKDRKAYQGLFVKEGHDSAKTDIPGEKVNLAKAKKLISKRKKGI